MSNTNNILRELQDRLREGAKQRIDDAFFRGFEEAALIYLGALSEKIDNLRNKIGPGNYLSNEEQILLSELMELKSETERSLSDFLGSVTTDEGKP